MCLKFFKDFLACGSLLLPWQLKAILCFWHVELKNWHIDRNNFCCHIRVEKNLFFSKKPNSPVFFLFKKKCFFWVFQKETRFCSFLKENRKKRILICFYSNNTLRRFRNVLLTSSLVSGKAWQACAQQTEKNHSHKFCSSTSSLCACSASSAAIECIFSI